MTRSRDRLFRQSSKRLKGFSTVPFSGLGSVEVGGSSSASLYVGHIPSQRSISLTIPTASGASHDMDNNYLTELLVAEESVFRAREKISGTKLGKGLGTEFRRAN